MKIISRPGFTVRTTGGIGYCANNLAYAHHDGVWCLTFICSGAMTIIPVREVASVEFNKVDGNHCNSCDEQLKAWPSGEGEPFVRDLVPT